MSFALGVLLISYSVSWAGITGKIAGRVSDAETGDPLPAANIIVEGTTMGAAADRDGYYVILNISPGTYTVKATMMGYTVANVTNVKVSVDFTTTVDFSLQATVLKGREISVVAQRPMVEMDLTSTLQVVDAEQISQLPVEDFQDIVNLQAGVVDGHFRGGRASEVSYMVDGISITDPYSNEASVGVENNAIQEVEVISGTFNAEYGQAMSGVVILVTKEGKKRLSGDLSMYSGDYVSNHKETFMNIDNINPLNINNVQGSLGGPLPGLDKWVSFFVTGRRYYNEGYLYGTRIFNPSDSCNFRSDNPNDWYIGATGDSTMVPMAPRLRNSLQLILTVTPFVGDKLKQSLVFEKEDFRDYDHRFKYNPDGDYKRYSTGFTWTGGWTHVFSSRTFSELKAAISFHGYRLYVYKDSLDSRYPDPQRLLDVGANAFYTGGAQMVHFERHTTSITFPKFDITSQVTRNHQLRMGIEGRIHELFLHEFEIRPNPDELHFDPYVPPLTTTLHNRYTNYPFEASAYIQDKIELKDMIVNAGLRFDYFNSNWKFPTDPRDPNPQNALKPDTLNEYDPENPLRVTGEPWFENAEPKMQLSPRFGIAYPITDKGVMHGSYGHFFQIPPFQYLYADPEFEVYPSGLETRMGNAELEPQKTVIYEIGLQQQLTDVIGIDVTGFFKDIRNLLGMKIYETYIMGRRYAQYINRDYGNVRGVTISLEKRHSNYIGASVDYTYQIAKGNASDPNAVFWDAKANRESEKRVVPLDWDQRHTINGTVIIGEPKIWSLSIIGRYGSGFPYTPSYENVQIAYENSERKPPQYNFDLRAHVSLKTVGFRYSVFLKIYNLLDRKNEVNVYSDTGRAGYTLAVARHVGTIRGINTVEEWFNRPNFYSEPRRVIVGFSMGF